MLSLFRKYSAVIFPKPRGHERRGGYFECEATKIHYLTVPVVLEVVL
jgi:hypothetical protein